MEDKREGGSLALQHQDQGQYLLKHELLSVAHQPREVAALSSSTHPFARSEQEQSTNEVTILGDFKK